MEVLRKFICLFIDKNFEFKDSKKTKNKLWHKKKIMKFIAKTMIEFPVFDVALIVYMRTLLASNLTEIEKKALRVNLFGKEPLLSFFDKFSEKLSVVINLFNFDMKEPELDIFHKIKKGKAGEPNDEMGFVLKDGNFYIVYHQEMVLGLYEKQKK